MQAIAEKMQFLVKSTSAVTETSYNTTSSLSQSTRSSAVDSSSFQRAQSPSSLQNSIGSGMSCRLSSIIRASQKDLPRPGDQDPDSLDAELRLDFSDTDLRAFGGAMRSNIIRLAQEIKSVSNDQEQAIDGVGRLVENVAKAMNTAIQRSEERITNELVKRLEEFQKTCHVSQSAGSADLVQATKALAETDNKELYSMLSTCTSLLEAMQMRLAQLEACNFDKRVASLEASMRSRSEGTYEQKDESMDNSIWTEALRSTLKRSVGTPVAGGEFGKRTSGTPIGSVPKSPSGESQASNLQGHLQLQSQGSQSLLHHGTRDGEALSREQQLQATQTEDSNKPVPTDRPRGRELSPAQLWQNANAELKKADGPPAPAHQSLLSRVKQLASNATDEGGANDTSQPRGRASVPGPAGQKQAYGGLRTVSPTLPSSAGRTAAAAAAYPARMRSAENGRPDGPQSSNPCISGGQSPGHSGFAAGVNRNLGPCGPHQRQQHQDPMSSTSLNNSNRGQQNVRAQSSQAIPQSGPMYMQPGFRRTSASVMGQPLRPGP
eukprot:TRINITY_DN20377_c0_g1_i1.p1 TRINITY_DN20377_c0_g1~~TRINITY_DN20377_c0_g1_i1.p1  ORF type:complete len:548 (+),score=96.24 TRINITY_DN20377_c0_g1_i1:110-1753(+)